MQSTGFHVRKVLAALGVVVAVATVTKSAGAQLAVSRSTERVLFLIPRPDNHDDSAYVVELALETRRRMATKYRHKVVVIVTEDVCKVLEESAYACDAILGPADGDRLARALRSDAYIDGRFWHEGPVPMARLRLVDIGRSGLSGWLTVRGTAGDPARQFAETVADSLENQVRAAELARECGERRDRGDFRGAKTRAERAFGLYPNHPSAAICAEVVSEALQEPVDSQIVMMQRATRGDSLNARAWERLGRLFQQKGDSLGALDAFVNQVAASPRDRQLTMGVVAGAITLREYEQARELADEWLDANSGDIDFLRLKARACVEGGLWQCALDALAAQYDLDSNLVGDSVFYQQIIGAAQVLVDSAAELHWSGEAVAHVPGSISLLRAHAAALAAFEMNDSVLVVYQRLLTMDSTDIRSALAGADILLEGLTIDTATPLDTARLFRAGEFLEAARGASQDTSVLMNVAVNYYQTGSAMITAQREIGLAIDWLHKSLANDVLGGLAQQANFFLGLGYMLQVFELDPRVMEQKSCELVGQEADLIALGKEAMTIGAELSPQQAQAYLQRYQAMEDRIPQLRRAFKCSSQ